MAVLSRARVFVTHGGINSAHEAMLQGVPLVVLPLAADHHVVAQQVAAVGAGVVLDRTGVTVDRLKALVTEVLETPSFAARSRAIGESLRAAGGARAAADHLEAYVARARAERICH
jgi:MGT family glycosyltransferase